MKTGFRQIEGWGIGILTAALLLFTGVEVLMNLTPPITRDALIHHLAVPMIWIQNGGFTEMPWAEYSYYPMNIDLLYLVCLVLKNDIAPKLIHMLFGVMTALLIYIYLRNKYGKRWGALGAVIFFTTPIVVWLCTSAYTDLGLTFFSTASVLAFLRWRNENYAVSKWFWVSALSMGLALGSKYNALIAFLILNLMMVFFHAKDCGDQVGAMKYGIIFCAVSIALASPWFIKNFILTGNPLYPLFNSLFSTQLQSSSGDVLIYENIRSVAMTNPMRFREVLYGENFWETISIPIRMFFQGQDDSYRYFQGQLNPILILFLPFAFLNRKDLADKVILVLFSVFFITVTFFMTAKQVRYNLPALPMLSILSVIGIKVFMDQFCGISTKGSEERPVRSSQWMRTFLYATVAGLLLLNLFYLKNHFQKTRPIPYLAGMETRSEFLGRTLKYYPAVEYINRNLPEDAVVFTLFLGRRGYYLERKYFNERSFGINTVQLLAEASRTEKTFKDRAGSLGATHLLIRNEIFFKLLADNYQPQESERLLTMMRRYWTLLYEQDGYSVWDIRAKAE